MKASPKRYKHAKIQSNQITIPYPESKYPKIDAYRWKREQVFQMEKELKTGQQL